MKTETLEKHKSFTEVFDSAIRFSVPLAPYTTLRIGGAAEMFIEVRDETTLSMALRLSHDIDIPVLVMGGDSNLLIPDEGFPGLAIKVTMNKITFDGAQVIARAGAELKRISAEAAKRELSGLEFAAGIPGTRGGAIVGNAGAAGSDMGNITQSVTGSYLDGTKFTFGREQLEFGYRRSVFKRVKAVISEVMMSLEKGKQEDIESKMLSARQTRKKTQPVGVLSAGSVFKNPPGDNAGRLIEEAGLKGITIGGAEISTKHAAHIVNRGGAAYDDVRKLMDHIQRVIARRFGVELEKEIVDLGEPP
ncbi:MAG: UDP-N-acetylmuramate dehydrogenase [Thermoplasmata archaeon]|nr:UDP-N-acetylmuramate dehydrogenase [Thermoplasmata archaeon]